MIKGHVRGVRGVKHSTVLPIKDQRLCMSEVSKVVFAAFTQHSIQSTVNHLLLMCQRCQILCAVLCIHSLLPLKGGRLFII